MDMPDFSDFYRELHKRAPFPWQCRLAEQARRGEWPATLALPTSSGKSSVVEIAVFALACQAHLPLAARKAPLRTFYIVDRRLIVDEVTANAVALEQALAKALERDDASALAYVARRLARLGDGVPLQVVCLRGGMFRDEDWTLRPDIPLICVSTVDQVGSRLLFRGYGISEFQRPVHAGLLGCDALYIIDEAHLSPALVQTVESVGRYQAWAEQGCFPWPRLVQMTATPSKAGARFDLDSDDRADPVLAKRLQASKRAELVTEKSEKFKDKVADLARQMVAREDVDVLGVIVNQVATARAVFTALSSNGDYDVVLLTGRVRPFDRDRRLDQCLPRIKAGRRERGPEEKKFIVVGTQCLEVGANLDFDGLVTELASLAALRQRFGRLDRLGRSGATHAAIVMRAEYRPKPEKEPKPKDKKTSRAMDPIYGEAAAGAWKWLEAAASPGKQRFVDFGVEALARAMEQHPFPEPEAASTIPALLPGHIDLWMQTSPTPHPDPDVAPFLHGKDALDAAEVQVLWRADLDFFDQNGWADIVSLAPPLVEEALSLPVWAVQSWLRGKTDHAPVSDLEGVRREAKAKDKSASPLERERSALRWARGDGLGLVEAAEIRPGDTIVVPASYGGCDEFGWAPESALPVSDIGDGCWNNRVMAAYHKSKVGARRVRLRLGPWLSRGGEEGATGSTLTTEFIQELFRRLDAGEKAANVLEDVLASYSEDLEKAADDPLVSLTRWALHCIREAVAPEIAAYPDDKGFVVQAPALRGPGVGLRNYEPRVVFGSDMDDEEAFGASVGLDAHSRGVASRAREFATRCGFPPDLIGDITLAALWHDAGKVYPPMQLVLHAGDRLAYEIADEPLAKSAQGAAMPGRSKALRASCGLPEGFRHEFLSATLAGACADIERKAHDFELVKYLIGTHHGRGRPLPPVEADAQEISVSVIFDGIDATARAPHGQWRLDSGWSDMFWRLSRRYGAWGLAYMEAIMRLADCSQSQKESACPN